MRCALVITCVLAGLAMTACSGGGGAAVPSPSATVGGVTPASHHAASDGTCGMESQSRSLNSDKPTSFTIENRTSDSLSVFWLDFQGNRVKYFDLGAGETHQQETFVTHPWVIANAAGACLRVFMVESPASISIV